MAIPSGTDMAGRYPYRGDLHIHTNRSDGQQAYADVPIGRNIVEGEEVHLPENDFVNICVDIAMRGVGSHACGPALPEQYEIPRQGKNTFRFVF